jgi:hypothetical protein
VHLPGAAKRGWESRGEACLTAFSSPCARLRT